MPLKDRKRHRDGQSTRSHHSKKFKEPVKYPSKDELHQSVKSGVDVCFRSSVGTPAVGDSHAGNLRLCKAYVEKVVFFSSYTLFSFNYSMF